MFTRSSSFRYELPASRLGRAHETMESFNASVSFRPSKSKKFSLVVVTEPICRRILLGMKNRGFGKGMYNSFGGKMSAGESEVDCASRELEEETGLSIPVSTMKDLKVGVLHFTFEDEEDEMRVHVYRLDVSCSSNHKERLPRVIPVDPSAIRGCDEISPQWFHDWHNIPLDNMFADDSVWLTKLLSCKEKITFRGYFHFKSGGQDINTVRDYYISFNKSKQEPLDPGPMEAYSLEKRLFHALHSNQIHSPSIKEFKESFAFTNVVRSFFSKNDIDVVIDVAGGHGALAALLLIMTSARLGVVLDPAQVGNGGVEKAWGSFIAKKMLRYRHECLRTGLADELTNHLKETDKRRIVVVACHACQHLSDEIVRIGTTFGVHVAVMPCCQKDTSPGATWKAASKNLSLSIETVMDLLLAGKAMSWDVGDSADVSYDVRLKKIDASITPQNRIILCRARATSAFNSLNVERAHSKLQHAYMKAHGDSRKVHTTREKRGSYLCLESAAVGFTVCLFLVFLFPHLMKLCHRHLRVS